MNTKNILEKILKCLALSKSSNEHEAATALYQARKLMEQHNISDAQLLSADVSESYTNAGASRKPSNWESHLSVVVSNAFDCISMFSTRLFEKSQWTFIGVGKKPEIAKYAFEVLYRQLKKTRTEFIKIHCKRIKTSSKTRRADLFCDAWVYAVYEKVRFISGNKSDENSITAYLEEKYPNRSDLKTQNRNKNNSFRQKDFDAINLGSAAGQKARLDRGIGQDSQALIGG